jgi:hypothetical protein
MTDRAHRRNARLSCRRQTLRQHSWAPGARGRHRAPEGAVARGEGAQIPNSYMRLTEPRQCAYVFYNYHTLPEDSCPSSLPGLPLSVMTEPTGGNHEGRRRRSAPGSSSRCRSRSGSGPYELRRLGIASVPSAQLCVTRGRSRWISARTSFPIKVPTCFKPGWPILVRRNGLESNFCRGEGYGQ